MNLFQFYTERFSADPFALIEDAYDDLNNIAAAAGINWLAVVPDIQLPETNGTASKFSKYTGHTPETTEPSFKGRADLYSRLETSRDGIQYPFINFVTKGHDSGSWSGLDYLWSEYRRFNSTGGTAVPLTDRERERLARIEAARVEREQRAHIAKYQAMQTRDQAVQFWLQFSQRFSEAAIDPETHPYLVKKGIADVLPFSDVRLVNEWDRGPTPRQCLAIPLQRIDGDHRIAGWQRIYPDGKKLNTPAVDGGDYTGACHVIGNLRTARRVAVAEGYASAASGFLAMHGSKKQFDAVIMALSANNVPHVVQQLVECYPALDVWCLLDNDVQKQKEGKGNAGIATGINVLKKYNIKCVYPIFENDKFNDFNDLHVNFGIKEARAQISKRANRLELPTNTFEAELQLLSVSQRVNKKQFMKQVGQVISAGLMFCPFRYSPKELIGIICRQLSRMGVEDLRDTVVNQVRRRFEKKCQKAQGFRSFSAKYTDPASCPEHVEYHYYDSARITPKIVDDIRMMGSGPVIVRAPMGSGKTQGLLRKLMQESDRGLAIAHRVSLISNMWDVLSRNDSRQRVNADILHYQDAGATEQARWAKKLTICVNSIIKGCWQPLLRQHDFLGFDEATQGLRATLSGKAMGSPVAVFNALIDGIASTDDHALLVDADANDMLVELCELAMQRREEKGLQAWSKIHIVELRTDTRAQLPDGSFTARRVFYTDVDRIMSEALNSAERGERFLLATDSKAFADQLLLLLRESYPNKRWLYVSQDTKPDAEVEAFTNEPNALASQYDGLIYSPAISSGVSIEVPHFTRHYGVFYGQVVPSDAIQMLRRDRTATEFVVGLGTLNTKREESASKLETGFIQALLDTGELAGEYCDAQLDGDRISFGLADSTYTRLKIKMAAAEAIARNDFANNLICLLFSDGYDVAHLEDDTGASAEGKGARKYAKERVWEQFVQLHDDVTTPTEQEREALLAQRSLTEEERARLDRWEIENTLQLPVDESSLKFFANRGKSKVALAELLRMDEVTARRIDRAEASLQFTYAFRRAGGHVDHVFITALTREEADEKFARMQNGAIPISVTSTPLVEIPDRSFAVLHRKRLRDYFTDCGIDPDTGTGEASPESMALAQDRLMNKDTEREFNAVIRFGGVFNAKGTRKRADVVFKAICEAVGLTPDKRRLSRSQGLGTRWFIVPESWAFIDGILQRRAAADVSAFSIMLDAGAKTADHDLSVSLDLQERSRSPESAEPTGLEDVVAGSPLPLAWARQVLPVDELKAVLAMPLHLVRRVLASLYFTEYLHTMTAGELATFKEWQGGLYERYGN
ncbi:hypothetical protein L3488_004156 [Salmonella enterica subsp. enterica serovar Agbeni]|nr:hypothetical protein [Salmonella enterica subsp. enterica serovar Agbeni]